ncbi:bacteriohemerythrin [Oceanospirillum sediminis]|uniref:Hemerythrin family protein n=1 Tax=Oceanospirillum sediminis TaxID=2760088 RepID=A0A839IMX5_9GAMM|nr:hemerythrin family protein [Oceanospirillum sediminis]MBB1486251.1 hemerythrin family protein [Oceanospirillum sediminis]
MTDMTSALRIQHYDQPAMDKAHHRFTAILGALPLASETAIPELLNNLRKEAQEHFNQEERFMQMTDYENYEGHRQQHETFLELLENYQKALDYDDSPDIRQVHRALCQWQDEHQQRWDDPLANFLNYSASWRPHPAESASQ